MQLSSELPGSESTGVGEVFSDPCSALPTLLRSWNFLVASQTRRELGYRGKGAGYKLLGASCAVSRVPCSRRYLGMVPPGPKTHGKIGASTAGERGRLPWILCAGRMWLGVDRMPEQDDSVGGNFSTRSGKAIPRGRHQSCARRWQAMRGKLSHKATKSTPDRAIQLSYPRRPRWEIR